jgi:hypothetical protein
MKRAQEKQGLELPSGEAFMVPPNPSGCGPGTGLKSLSRNDFGTNGHSFSQSEPRTVTQRSSKMPDSNFTLIINDLSADERQEITPLRL